MAKDMFHVGTQVLIGKERFSGIFDGMTKVLIVTDKFMHESGTVSYVTDVLDHLKVEWKIFSEVRPDPDIMTVSKGVAMILEFQPQAVVALGLVDLPSTLQRPSFILLLKRAMHRDVSLWLFQQPVVLVLR